MTYNIKISIVTICKNAKLIIEKTLKSVVSQSFDNYEYIIQDGLSNDNTLEIVKKYQRNNMYIYSEKDEGIYDAMNKAVTHCKGEWIIFMNAGDIFYNENVLSDIFSRKIDGEAKIIYGHTMYCFESKFSIISNHNIQFLNREVCYCHQSILAKRELLMKNAFNTKYSILADYEWLIRMWISGIQFKQVNCIISKYMRNGLSAKAMLKTSQEETEIHNLYFPDNKKRTKFIRIFLKEQLAKKFPKLSEISFCYKQMKRIYKY